MAQRLSLATALLGDPGVLLLDEPGNGLDPQGTAWLRDLLRGLAAEGRTVLVSSHVLSEVEQVADRVIVIRDGRLVATDAVAELAAAGGGGVLVGSPDADRLEHLLLGHAGTTVERAGDRLRVTGATAAEIAAVAAAHGLRVHELTAERSSLEQTFLSLTHQEARP